MGQREENEQNVINTIYKFIPKYFSSYISYIRPQEYIGLKKEKLRSVLSRCS